MQFYVRWPVAYYLESTNSLIRIHSHTAGSHAKPNHYHGAWPLFTEQHNCLQSRSRSPRFFWSAPRHGLVLIKRHVGSECLGANQKTRGPRERDWAVLKRHEKVAREQIHSNLIDSRNASRVGWRGMSGNGGMSEDVKTKTENCARQVAWKSPCTRTQTPSRFIRSLASGKPNLLINFKI